MAFWIPILIGLALTVVSVLLRPRPKMTQPSQARDFEAPTADAGRSVPVVFGTLTVKGVNVVWNGDTATREEKVKM